MLYTANQLRHWSAIVANQVFPNKLFPTRSCVHSVILWIHAIACELLDCYRPGGLHLICTKCRPSQFAFNVNIKTSSKVSPVLCSTRQISNEITVPDMWSSDTSCFDKAHCYRPPATMLLQWQWRGKVFTFCRKQGANKTFRVTPLRQGRSGDRKQNSHFFWS